MNIVGRADSGADGLSQYRPPLRCYSSDRSSSESGRESDMVSGERKDVFRARSRVLGSQLRSVEIAGPQVSTKK
jgi:hypothetical protein